MNIVEIIDNYPTELDAVQYFEKVRWGKKPKCAYCESGDASKRLKDMRYKCYACNRSFSVTTKSQIHNTRMPLKTWMLGFSIVTDAKKGLSALQLQRNLNISYPTAHSMYMKMREMMVEPINKLDDIVEIDEAYIGGKPRHSGKPSTDKEHKRKEMDENIDHLEKKHKVKFSNSDTYQKPVSPPTKRGRGTRKIPVVGIVERDGNVVAEVMRTLSAKNLRSMVEKYVDEDESILVTDEFKGYSSLEKIIDKISIEHQKKVYSYKGVNTNTIESFWAIMKRGITGQYHHVSPKYLPDYITEFVFKWNNRNKDDMFETLVKNAMKNKEAA